MSGRRTLPCRCPVSKLTIRGDPYRPSARFDAGLTEGRDLDRKGQVLIMGLFGRKKKAKAADEDFNLADFMQDMEPLMQKSLQLTQEFNAALVKCRKCGKEFTSNEGYQLFHSMAKESVNYDPSCDSILMCGDCFSIYTYHHDYEHTKIVLDDDVTHEKETYLQEKYL
jgi:hypothetical protein